MPVGINEGTQTFITSTANGTEVIPHSQISGGTVKVSVGTIATGTLQNLVSGTINALALGTILGTVQTYGLNHVDAFGTVVSTGTNAMGTIKAGVAGSVIYVTDLVISAGSATNVEIGNGGTGNLILGTLFLNANGGAVMNFRTPINTASGSSLIYKQSTAISPLSITARGYVD